MKILVGKQWKNDFLDYHRSKKEYRIQVLAWKNLEKIEELCEQTNTKLEVISTSSQEGIEFKNIGGIGGILRY